MAQSISQESVAITGLPGATAASRYVGATASGAPVSGNFVVGDYIIDQTGKFFVCTTAGSPGTWTQAVGGVTTFSAGTTGLTPNTATNGAVTLAGTLGTANGGTNLTTFTAANNAIYSTSSSALTAGTLPVLAGGTGVTTSTGSGSNVLSTSPSLTTPLLTGAMEVSSISATALSASTAATLTASSGMLYIYTANPTAAFTIAITGAPTTTGQVATFTMGVNNGSTAYLPSNITINGIQAGASSTALPLQGATNNGIQTWYQTGTAWATADVSTYDFYTMTVISTGSSTWLLFLSQTKF